MEPKELVRRCKQTLPDDPRAFEALVAYYKERVFATAYRLMSNRHDAEDVTQEVFLKVYRGIKNLDDPETLTSWIYRITTNACFDLLDKHKRQTTTSLTPDDLEDEQEITVADNSTPTPEEAAVRNELRRCLEETLRQMDYDSRATLVLRDIEDRPYQEIAGALKIGMSAAKMRIHRARLLFQETLRKVCPDAWQATGV